MGIKPRPSRTLELGRSTSSIPASPLPLSPCPPASGSDYQREVFNGDMGVITAIDPTEQEVIVQYQERSVTYDYADLNEIALAWSVSIHKS